eukprot:6334552-Amphidinium_carterae.1
MWRRHLHASLAGLAFAWNLASMSIQSSANTMLDVRHFFVQRASEQPYLLGTFTVKDGPWPALTWLAPREVSCHAQSAADSVEQRIVAPGVSWPVACGALPSEGMDLSGRVPGQSALQCSAVRMSRVLCAEVDTACDPLPYAPSSRYMHSAVLYRSSVL